MNNDIPIHLLSGREKALAKARAKAKAKRKLSRKAVVKKYQAENEERRARLLKKAERLNKYKE
jgi:RNA-splicing ligase RtcB